MLPRIEELHPGSLEIPGIARDEPVSMVNGHGRNHGIPEGFGIGRVHSGADQGRFRVIGKNPSREGLQKAIKPKPQSFSFSLSFHLQEAWFQLVGGDGAEIQRTDADGSGPGEHSSAGPGLAWTKF